MHKITSFGEALWDNLPSGKCLAARPSTYSPTLPRSAQIAALSAVAATMPTEQPCSQPSNANASPPISSKPTPNSLPAKCWCNWITKAARITTLFTPARGTKSTPAKLPKRVAQSDVFVFGSLAVRDAVSRQALAELLPHATFKIFDVNLRPPHYQFPHLRDMMQQADFIKFNDDELYEIAAALGSPYRSMEQNLHFIAEHTHTRQICVTLGKHGALYFCDGELFVHHGYRVNVADTVGAGDSFLAGFIHQFLQRKSPPETLAFACALGSLVASRHGATPEITLTEIDALMHPQ